MQPRATVPFRRVVLAFATILGSFAAWATPCHAAPSSRVRSESPLDDELARALSEAGFTGRIESTLESRLGRPVNPSLAELGRLLYFDNLLGLHDDNSCAGCHSPAFAFGDSQSIAIGVDNNGLVGPGRRGPRNQRKAPPVVNSAFFPKQMLNGRFRALSGDPFDNSLGFAFPEPEGVTRFPPNDPRFPTLLAAQGHIPPTELVEMAGFTGTAGTMDPKLDPFDDGEGEALPPPDESGFRNEPIRERVLERLDGSAEYRRLFGEIFNDGQPFAEGGIELHHIGLALAEFQISLTFADAPIDRFARGERSAMTPSEKRGALLFFGKARCVECHAVAGDANEMFSDFENHVIGVPQVAPLLGRGTCNVIFDGPGEDEDFGAEQVTGDPADRYAFRTSPLRNVALQPAFFHNGAFTRLEDAIRHHLDVFRSARSYDPARAGIARDLRTRLGPVEPVLERVDPVLAEPVSLAPNDFEALVAFVRKGLLDSRATRESLCALVPPDVPSGRPVADFQGCEE